jgi:UDP-N-acetyl-D-glucosamine dehydrogenase
VGYSIRLREHPQGSTTRLPPRQTVGSAPLYQDGLSRTMYLDSETERKAASFAPSKRVCVIGLGFAGLPTATAIATAGHQTTGLDIDAGKVESINSGQATSGLPASAISTLVELGTLSATTDTEAIARAEVVLISVPTPIDGQGRPDETAVEKACETVLRHVSDGTLIVMQCTTVPGTTRRLLVDPLNAAGRKVGRDVFVAFSPERINPGDPVYNVGNTTKLVAGATHACLERGREFVGSFVSTAMPVASIETAELAKLVENTFRFINISFVNELAVLCDRFGVNTWDVIQAAASKPFAFMAHFPGPGIGGDCIPVSPRYLQAAAERKGLASEVITASVRATGRMPGHVADRLAALLTERGRMMNGARIIVVGLAYKPDIADTRHSPAVGVIHELESRGVEVLVHDPLATGIVVDGVLRPSVPLDKVWPTGAVGADAAIVITPHSSIDYASLAGQVGVVLDTRNALRAVESDRIVSL